MVACVPDVHIPPRRKTKRKGYGWGGECDGPAGSSGANHTHVSGPGKRAHDTVNETKRFVTEAAV